MSDIDIWKYARDGHLAAVRLIVVMGGKSIINTRESETGDTALICASLHGHLPVVQCLVSWGANINDQDNGGWTALMCASQNGHLPIVQYLVNNGANINDKTNNENTALFIASQNGHLPIVQYLISNGANINDEDKYGDTALFIASREGHLPVVQYLVSKGANINDKNKYGDTVLIEASREGHLPVVQYLVSKGANINDKSNSGWTALMCTSREGHLPIVQYLLSVGADKTNFGIALYFACNPNPEVSVSDSTAIEIIKTLIANGADENTKNGSKTPAENARNDTIRNALTRAVQDKKNGKLQSYVVNTTLSSSTPAPAPFSIPFSSLSLFLSSLSGSKNTSYASNQPSTAQNAPQQQRQLEKSIKIKDGDNGYSYTTVFSSYLQDLVRVLIEDPYIRREHQLANFVRFCELLVTSKTLREIQLVTGKAKGKENLKEQKSAFDELAKSLNQYGVTLTVEYSNVLHDREIVFDNGWVIKIGRGLDYFKGKYSIGFSDWDLRSCQATTIDIFKQ